jgi:4-amino-4-deoxy-L-arabinose transferase-like glycosyltransferase
MEKDICARTERRPLIALVVLCLIAWLPGFFTLPPLDRDESRFAQATKQMLETGDFIDINLGSGPRYAKPVGIYWLQAASTAALGEGVRDKIWTYRVPSALGALAAVIATYWLARNVAGREAAFAAGAGFRTPAAPGSGLSRSAFRAPTPCRWSRWCCPRPRW